MTTKRIVMEIREMLVEVLANQQELLKRLDDSDRKEDEEVK